MDSIFLSKPFTFIIRGKPFYVHASLVSACSAPLSCMISGPHKEAHQGFAILEEVTEDTFTRFVRWMYSKDYKAAEHTLSEDDWDPGSDTVLSSWSQAESNLSHTIGPDDWFDAPLGKKKKKNTPESTSLKQRFVSWGTTRFPVEPQTASDVRPNTVAMEDYTEVFLSHAQVYVFAEKYDIQPLKKLALKKLYDTLTCFALFHKRVKDILSLIKYVYAETSPSSTGTEDIRNMLMFYVATEMETVESHGGFKELLIEDPDMLGDFLATLARNIRTY
ncbi:uncharacterized protein KY384_007934 [Bacidia gigantensis]|uniref:uncharacterized protein n=1 Tax=Bacidia gigantensis TaxID=2732470 RepID=UPI001D053D47|nr:uncharacterized protein KY384_007934 [Bacidia gigantensis]KAG8527780.1 hypothetical protein KY384_007934 [Bacidia gigantensis]